ncbi:Venestatin [Aphelenchoides besseyi]|nr:Venestatin [Aphelenchoides besseyi]
MTPEQLQYHYFTLHDVSSNHLFLLLSIFLVGQKWTFGWYRVDQSDHSFPSRYWFLMVFVYREFSENPTNQHNDPHVPPPLPSEVELEQMIDSILNEDDYNKDGFIDYVEFLHAQRQREEQMKRQQQQTPPPR